jgi:hypothetical protein
VSHFRPFNKIDIFYFNQAHLAPSPWYTLPIQILHDPSGVVVSLLEQSKGERFDVSEDDIDFSISKGLAATHETYRRAMRGELAYAQTLLDELRHHVMRADDRLFGRTPETAVFAKFERRGSQETLAALAASYRRHDAEAILHSLHGLVRYYRGQIAMLHEHYQPSRPLSVDLEVLDTVLGAVMPPSP